MVKILTFSAERGTNAGKKAEIFTKNKMTFNEASNLTLEKICLMVMLIRK